MGPGLRGLPAGKGTGLGWERRELRTDPPTAAHSPVAHTIPFFGFSNWQQLPLESAQPQFIK